MGLYVNQCQTSENYLILRGIWQILEMNILPLKVLTINKMPSASKTIFAKSTSSLRTIPPNSNILQHFKTDSFFISFFVLKISIFCVYIVVLSQQSVDWMFDFSFSESETSTCSPLNSYSKDRSNFCENSQV